MLKQDTHEIIHLRQKCHELGTMYSDKFEEWVQAVNLTGEAIRQRDVAREERDEARRELRTERLKFRAARQLLDEYQAENALLAGQMRDLTAGTSLHHTVRAMEASAAALEHRPTRAACRHRETCDDLRRLEHRARLAVRVARRALELHHRELEALLPWMRCGVRQVEARDGEVEDAR